MRLVKIGVVETMFFISAPCHSTDYNLW